MTESVENRSNAFGTVTVRAVVLGLITVAWMCIHADYELHVSGSSVMTLSNFPICALIVFVLWVMINAAWRAISPRRALKPMELLTIMIMAWAAGMMPARGWAGRIVGLLATPQHWASSENRWEEIFHGILQPDGLLPRWLFPSIKTQAGNWFYGGLPGSQMSIPWHAWGPPLFWWGTAAAAMVAVAIAISVIFHRQWATYERLTFPLASVPIALVSVRENERVAPIFKNKFFWIGILMTAGVLCWNIVGYFYETWPKIGIYKTSWEIRQEIITGYPYVSFRIMPPVIGFLYLANLDLLFSLWVFWLIGWIETGMVDTMGLAVGEVGKKLGGAQIVQTHNYGAVVFLAVWSVWVARRHLKQVWRAAVSRDRAADNPGGAMKYRTALVLLLVGLAYLVFFGLRLGMSIGVLVPALLVILIAFFVTAKYMAATGMPYVTTPAWGNGKLITSILGNNWMSVKSAVGLGLMHSGAFGAGARVFGLGMMPHALKIGEQAPRGRSRILVAAVLALAVGAGVSIWHTAWLGYNRGALRMDNYTLRTAPPNEIQYIATTIEDIQKHRALPMDLQKFAMWAVGFVGAGVFTILHARVGWWPLHPVGLAFSATSVGNTYWLSIFIVWLTKLVILKVGGARLYEKVKPLFIGLIVGYVFGLIASYATDAIFFYGGYGHVVHDW